MSTERAGVDGCGPSGFDAGLLSPVTVGHDAVVSDAAVLTALIEAEAGLVRAWAAVGALPPEQAEGIASALLAVAGLDAAGAGAVPARGGAATDAAPVGERAAVTPERVTAAAVGGGNPVIPLVGMLRAAVPEESRRWVHHGATSQDIVDTALMLVARRAVERIADTTRELDPALAAFAREHRDDIAVARTLGQHAVPTTVGRRAAGWLGGVRRATARLEALTLPAQLGGAGGTRASFVELGGDAARELPARYAAELGLDDAGEVWHTARWPVTELGDALAQLLDALGKTAGDVALLSRTEIGELVDGAGGGSSAMPQKNNPVSAVLIRSAALRAPQLAATLHLASALAADERPDGAWHAEWPVLRELLRLALGASAHAVRMLGALEVDPDAVARNLALTRGLVLAERLSLVLGPRIGAAGVAQVVAEVAAGEQLESALRRLPEVSETDAAALANEAGYLGDAREAVDRVAGSGSATTDLHAMADESPTEETPIR